MARRRSCSTRRIRLNCPTCCRIFESSCESSSRSGQSTIQRQQNLGTMALPGELRTDRLRLRRWRPEDREPFARLNADPRVVEFLPQALSRDESDTLADRIEDHFQRHEFGL